MPKSATIPARPRPRGLASRSARWWLGLGAVACASRAPAPIPAPPEPEPVLDPEPAPEPPEPAAEDPPAPGELPEVSFPALHRFELPNRLQVVVVEDHRVPTVDVALVVGVGELHDRELTPLLARMLLEDSTPAGSERIAQEWQQRGSLLSVGVGLHETVLSTRLRRRDLTWGLVILGVLARDPPLSSSTLARIRAEQLVALDVARASPQVVGRAVLWSRLYPKGHPYAPGVPRADALARIGAEELQAFHDVWFRPNNARLVLVGAISPADARQLATRAFGRWTPRRQPFPKFPLEAYAPEDYQAALPTAHEVHVVDTQAATPELFIGNLALARDDANWANVEVVRRVFQRALDERLSGILGVETGDPAGPPSLGGLEARDGIAGALGLRVVGRLGQGASIATCRAVAPAGVRGLASDRRLAARVWAVAGCDPMIGRELGPRERGLQLAAAKGVGPAYFVARSKAPAAVLEAYFDELDRLHGHRAGEPDPPAAAFERARGAVLREFWAGLASAEQLGARVHTQLLFGLAEDHWDRYVERLFALQREEIKQLARRYLHPIPIVVIVGRADQILPQIDQVERLRDADVFVYGNNLERVTVRTATRRATDGAAPVEPPNGKPPPAKPASSTPNGAKPTDERPRGAAGSG